MSEIVIKVENLSKEYRLGVLGYRSLAQEIQEGLDRLLGRKGNEVSGFEGQKKGDRFMALKDISFELRAGERIGVIGHNGAGKSTLLKILSQVTTPTSGSAKIKGRLASLLEVGTGFHPELTGRENVYLNGAILGMSREEVKKKFDEIIEFAGVQDYVDTPVKRYSSGMHVRLGFAVAAHLEPDILIVDEVLAVGDAAFQKKCLGKMEEVSNNLGRTIVFVSHNMDAIRRLCGVAMLLKEGRQEIFSTDVNLVVDQYFSSIREVSKGEYTRDELKFAITSPLIDLTGARLVNAAGEVQTEFAQEDDFFLEVDFEVRQAGTKVYPWAVLKEVGGRPVWTGTNRPEASETPDPLFGQGLEPGSYRSKLRVPGGTINEGEYSIDTGLNVLPGRREGPEVIEQFLVSIQRPRRLVEAQSDKYPGIIFRPMSWMTAKR